MLRDDTPDTAPGIRNVAGTSRDEMEVAVGDRLAGGSARIHAHIEARHGGLCPQDMRARVLQQVADSVLLRPAKLEEIRNVATGHDQQMSSRRREAVVNQHGEGVVGDDGPLA